MKILLISILATLSLTACGNDDIYTLYRTGVGLPELRIHIATFDSDDSRDAKFKTYNQDNCQIAAQLFQSQPNVSTKYWCEKGAYKK
ncbi:hypothetical protein B0G85_0467 [Polynucleobacter brandtiae]|uniref:Lipoprotein n=1 Tax=Polynucleobacter brandtiae TaxID=1938816 RepID=A0A2M8VYY8_9BURK|nr:hypothetical protein B0G85_0467 [Polynucleobacter brandtiae]